MEGYRHVQAEWEVLSGNPNQLVAGAVATDDGNELARGTGTVRRSDVEPTPEIGYE
jgi:hypothetical protein